MTQEGRALRFVLPVVEQYFAAKAVLSTGIEILDTGDLVVLDKWRYPLLLTITLGSWRRITAILKAIGHSHPGFASWLVARATPSYVQASSVQLPDHLECARRLRTALETWNDNLETIMPLSSLTDESGRVRTVGAYAVEDQLSAGLKIRPSTDNDVQQLPYGLNPFTGEAPDGSAWGPARFGSAPTDFAAWPWRWSLDWLSTQIEKILRGQMLVISDCEPFQQEREWSIARALVGQSGNLAHQPIKRTELLIHVNRIISAMNTQGVLYANLGRTRKVIVDRDELADLAGRWNAVELTDPDSRIRRPYPLPDQLSSPRRWIEDLYSGEALRSLAEQVYANALTIYGALVDFFFPKIKPMLGIACILPVKMQCRLLVSDEESLGATLDYVMEPIATYEQSQVHVDLVVNRTELQRDPESTLTRGRRLHQLIEQYHPRSMGWALPRRDWTAIHVFKDKPATCQAYRWLWEDLKNLYLIEGPAPTGEDWG